MQPGKRFHIITLTWVKNPAVVVANELDHHSQDICYGAGNRRLQMTIFVASTRAPFIPFSLQWRHNGRYGIPNHRRLDCLLSLFRRRSKKYQSSVSLAFVRGIHRWPGNSPHKGPVTQKMFPSDDVIMFFWGISVFAKVSLKSVVLYIYIYIYICSYWTSVGAAKFWPHL